MNDNAAIEKLIFHDVRSAILDITDLQQKGHSFTAGELSQIEIYRDMLSSVLDMEKALAEKAELLEAAE